MILALVEVEVDQMRMASAVGAEGRLVTVWVEEAESPPMEAEERLVCYSAVTVVVHGSFAVEVEEACVQSPAQGPSGEA